MQHRKYSNKIWIQLLIKDLKKVWQQQMLKKILDFKTNFNLKLSNKILLKSHQHQLRQKLIMILLPKLILEHVKLLKMLKGELDQLEVQVVAHNNK